MSIEDRTYSICVAAVGDVFNAPDVNPFSERETDVLGEAAIDQLLRQLQLHPLRKMGDETLAVVLPPDQITPELESRLPDAIRRYCAARIEDNRLQVRISRRQHTFGLVLVTLISLAAIAIAALLVLTLLADAPQVLQGMILASTSVFVWVIMWDPLEALLFDWAMPARENRALERIMEMKVQIQAQE